MPARFGLILPAALLSSALLGVFWIWSLVRKKPSAQRFVTTTRLSLMDGEVQRACLFIEKHFHDQNLTPAAVCEKLTTGQAFLETMFERELGVSLADYIGRVRINHAVQVRKWSQAADAPSVALQCGFADEEQFKELYKKLTGADFPAPGADGPASAR